MSRITRAAVCTLAFAAAILLATTGVLHAQSRGGAGGVAVVNVVKLFNEYQRQKDLTEEMRQKKAQLDAENQQRRGRIESLEATINVTDPSDPTYMDKTKQLLKEQIEFKNWFDLIQADMTREVGVWTARIYQEILQSVREVAEQDGYDLVLYIDEFQPTGVDPDMIREQIRSRKVIYARSTVDLTQRVLDKLNTQFRALPRRSMLQVGMP